MKENDKWQAVKNNNADYDGSFIYAVKTTGIYCRPSCNSRLPKRENVDYFSTSSDAETAGYRPCKRCFVSQADAEAIVKQACIYIAAQESIPKLEAVAAHVGLSANYFQKLFSDVLGISPRSYKDSQRQSAFKSLLQQGDDISGALHEAGFGSPSRVYEFANRYLGMTPKTYKQGGKHQQIGYTVVKTALGQLLIAATEKGLCKVSLGDDADALREELEREFHAADLVEADAHLREWTQSLIDYLAGRAPWPNLPYDLQATAFQRQVWEWLRSIPAGTTYHYDEVAKAIGKPKAARAVARACASNPVALVIPCHRILPKSGGVGGFRWKPERKKELLEIERRLAV
jgi:AraC family transcriptional regulator of adaptative response/methylated-DNA-[protein]-cysteine methyltransferase